MNNPSENLRYPIGRFTWQTEVSDTEILVSIKTIEAFPQKIRREAENLSDTQLDTPYRPEGWTVRQVIHHCADSHMNAYIRFKLALTEDTPTIKPYDQDKWASLSDSQRLHPEVSLDIIKGTHERWVMIMRNMSKDDWNRAFIHPEYDKTYVLKSVAQMYAWHCEHHLAHVLQAKAKAEAKEG